MKQIILIVLLYWVHNTQADVSHWKLRWSYSNRLSEKVEPDGYKLFSFIRSTYLIPTIKILSTASSQDARVSSLLINILYF